MTVKGILCFSWKNLIFTLLFKINFIYNQGALNQEKAILKMNNIIMLKGSDFSFTSPIVLGSVGVVAIIILVLMVIYYIRNKKSQEDEKKPNVEKKEKNEKDENKDNEEVKDEEQECKEVENIENIEKPEVVDKGDTTLGI